MEVEVLFKRTVVFEGEYCLKACPGIDMFGRNCNVFNQPLQTTKKLNVLRCKECHTEVGNALN